MQSVGIVLCGGDSRRMGTDKASIGDPPWAHRVAAALQDAGCETVELQGGSETLATLSWPHFGDLRAGGGPVPAIVQAARRHRGHALVVAACDLPNLGAGEVSWLMAEVEHDSAPAAAYRVHGRANWSLVALDAVFAGSLSTLEANQTSGRSLGSLFEGVAKLLEPANPVPVTDIDSPDDATGGPK